MAMRQPAAETAPAPRTIFSRSYGGTADPVALQRVRTSPEYRAQTRTATFRTSDNIIIPPGSPFRTIRLDHARALGLDGAGQTIAIMDNGFLTTHQEFAGKAVSVVANPAAKDHGTGVAALAAGREDGVGMMGVAPEAGLLLTAFLDASGNTSRSALAAGTTAAADRGAVVQNNSWSFNKPIGDMQAYLRDNPNATVEQAFTHVVGGSAEDGAAYIRALRRFTQNGIVVFSASNNHDDTTAHMMAGLPLVAPEMEAGWLVAINAVATFQDDEIVGGTRLSAPCLEMAAHCLAAEGPSFSANMAANDSYQRWNGTSFAAPQISGGIALLAQAFPDLPASDLKKRLLASAANGFYQHTGSTDFGNGVTHGYNSEFGHGFMDLRAALRPIGAVGMPASESAYGPATPLGSSFAVGGAAHGDALAEALADVELSVFDALGADFTVSGSVLAGTRKVDRTGDLARFMTGAGSSTGAAPVSSFAWSPMDNGLQSRQWRFATGETGAVLGHFGLAPAASGLFAAEPSRLFQLAPDALSAGISVAQPSMGALSFYSFASPQEVSEGDSEPRGAFGSGMAYSFTLGNASLHLGASALGEQGASLAFESHGDFLGDIDGASGAVDFGMALPLGERLQFAFGGQLGTNRGTGTAGLTSVEADLFTGFDASLTVSNLWRGDDRLTFSVSQPLRLEKGTANLRLPAGRSVDGQIRWQDVAVDLEPSAREIDLGFEFVSPLAIGGELKFGASVAFNDNHEAGQRETAFAAAYRHRF